MGLQGAHRTSGVTIHLVLLPSHQRTHQAICTLPVPFKNKVLASSKISTATDLSRLIPWRYTTSLAPWLMVPS